MAGSYKYRRRGLGFMGRFGFIVTAFGIFIILLNIVQLFTMQSLFTYTAKREMLEAAGRIASLDLSDPEFNQILANIEGENNIYVEIYQPKEVLVYTSNSNRWIYDQDKHSNTSQLSPRIMKVLSHSDNEDHSYFETRQEFFATAEYIVYGNFTMDERALELYYPVETIQSSARTTSFILMIISVFLYLAALTVSIIFTTTFNRPLTEIISTTKSMTQLDFSRRCPPFRLRELDELSSSINALSAALELTLKDLKVKNRRLEQDIERERQLIEARKIFIANASHELKTPIAIIQGYAEGLKYGITEDSPEEYCDTIIDEAQKMNELVLRMLELTRLENMAKFFEFEPIVIADVLSEHLHSRRVILAEKGIKAELHVPLGFIAQSNREIIETIFSNYLSNAISHCEGEKLIKISADEDKGRYIIRVFNTGKTIADEDIEHIWQSFYRADKAHSRSEGRFGLGLAIVASTQNSLGLGYGAENKENGVEFWFEVSRFQQ